MSLDINKVIDRIKKTKIIPLFYSSDHDSAIKILKAVYEGGLDLLEFTNRGPEAYDVFRKMQEFKFEKYTDMLIGAGSIVDAAAAEIFIDAGADFIVSPLLNKEVIDICKERKILSIPGCSTLSEIYQARVWGATLTKVFPAEQLGGPAFIRAIKGPCPWLSLIVTGGVRSSWESLKAWHEAGADGFGLGSDLISGNISEEGYYEELTQKVRYLVNIAEGLSDASKLNI